MKYFAVPLYLTVYISTQIALFSSWQQVSLLFISDAEVPHITTHETQHMKVKETKEAAILKM